MGVSAVGFLRSGTGTTAGRAGRPKEYHAKPIVRTSGGPFPHRLSMPQLSLFADADGVDPVPVSAGVRGLAAALPAGIRLGTSSRHSGSGFEPEPLRPVSTKP
jgi:hypothetical protein